MNTDAMVLRALLRLARRRLPADEAAIVLRVGATAPQVREALRRLDARGLVERARTPRLTMAGLTLAVALLPRHAAAPSRDVRTPRAA
jgi:Mn-dependent DtxR family transcriptional regulator